MNKANFILCIVCIFSGCTDTKQYSEALEQVNALEAQLDSLKTINALRASQADSQIATFLTFQKEDAEPAMNFYISLFENSKIEKIKRWGKDAPSKEGTIMHATFTLNGKRFMCSDSPPVHDWDFTPGVSNYVECKNDSELERLFTKLSQDGEVIMPLNNYGFSQKFGWVVDQFGISWQLNLE